MNTQTETVVSSSETVATPGQDGGAPRGRSPGRSVFDVITQRIIELLDAGTVPWRKPWRRGASGMPQNMITRRPYRGINVFLLSCAPYTSPYWLTFKQAKQLGGSVRKGERGFPIVFWSWIGGEEEGSEDSPSDATANAGRRPLLRYYTVFNVEQCDGVEVPSSDDVAVSCIDPIEEAERLVAGMPNAPVIEDNEGRAFYRPATDRVGMPRRGLFESAAEYYSTLFHELGHATGHTSRLNRKAVVEGSVFGDSDYSQEELVAEMTAAYLCAVSGIAPATIENSAAYIQGWLKKLRDDKTVVVYAAAQAQKAADYVLGAQPPVEASEVAA
jgi:antirestriction protein ArdC